MKKVKKNKLFFIGHIFYWSILVVLILVAGIVSVSVLNIPGNYKFLVVQSGSMEPAIKLGSVVVVKPTKQYQKGDIITFTTSNFQNSVTHRVIEVKNEKEKTTFITKGNANNGTDPQEISSEQVLGKMIMSYPYLGYLINFAKTLRGLILLVIIPSVIIVYEELKNIKEELVKILNKASRPERKVGKIAKGFEQGLIKKISLEIVFLLFILQFFQVGTSLSYFSDQETISGNSFSVGIWDTEEPCEDCDLNSSSVVINEVYYEVENDGSKGTENKNEWIELYNNSDSDISLKNWQLEDGQGNIKTINPEVSIPAHGFAVLSHDNSTWTQYWNLPLETVTINLTGGSAWLNNSGDSLTLKNSAAEEVDFVAWQNFVSGWNLTANEGESISRKTSGVDTNVVDDWQDLETPTPGS